MFGGTPLAMPPQDMYDGLHRGTIDAVLTPWSAFSPYKLNEVTSYHVEIPLGGTTSMIFMMKKRYDALPAAARKALEDNGLEAQSRLFGAYLKNQGVEQRAIGVAAEQHRSCSLPPDRGRDVEGEGYRGGLHGVGQGAAGREARSSTPTARSTPR